MILDITGRPQYLLRYKIQEGKNQPVSVFSFRVGMTIGLWDIPPISEAGIWII